MRKQRCRIIIEAIFCGYFLIFDELLKFFMKYLTFLLAVIFLTSCQRDEDKPTAESIIDQTIEKAGGERYRRATIEFKFRDYNYKSTRRGGEFTLERQFIDTIGIVRDVVSNTGYQRFINDSIVTVPDSMKTRYASSINSVHYFAHLPYALNDRAVNKELAGEAEIKGESFYQLRITFQQEGGGADHHDEFMYWIHKENYTIDYLAYKFLVNKGGVRFREAYNQRVIEGIRFADYRNYTIDDFTTDLSKMDELFEEGKLEMMSTIETEVLNVQLRK